MQEGLNPIITKWLEVSERCLKRCEDNEDEITDAETASDKMEKDTYDTRRSEEPFPETDAKGCV